MRKRRSRRRNEFSVKNFGDQGIRDLEEVFIRCATLGRIHGANCNMVALLSKGKDRIPFSSIQPQKCGISVRASIVK